MTDIIKWIADQLSVDPNVDPHLIVGRNSFAQLAAEFLSRSMQTTKAEFAQTRRDDEVAAEAQSSIYERGGARWQEVRDEESGPDEDWE